MLAETAGGRPQWPRDINPLAQRNRAHDGPPRSIRAAAQRGIGAGHRGSTAGGGEGMDGPDPWSELVSRWYELRRQGRAVSPEELCDDPAGAAELRRRLEALAGMEAFVGQVNGPESLTRPAGA